MGYETRLHDGGSSLSGGQRQRMALARALVRRPSILLLDEATSELDTVTEQRVYGNLANLSSTTIVIAHRLSTVRNAHRIVVLDRGAIVESGTHAELVASGGVYHRLISAQSSLGGPPAAEDVELDGTAVRAALLAPDDSVVAPPAGPGAAAPRPVAPARVDFIGRMRDEIDGRIETLRPSVDEYARLEAALEALRWDRPTDL
jgi:hypothetical protein